MYKTRAYTRREQERSTASMALTRASAPRNFTMGEKLMDFLLNPIKLVLKSYENEVAAHGAVFPAKYHEPLVDPRAWFYRLFAAQRFVHIVKLQYFAPLREHMSFTRNGSRVTFDSILGIHQTTHDIIRLALPPNLLSTGFLRHTYHIHRVGTVYALHQGADATLNTDALRRFVDHPELPDLLNRPCTDQAIIFTARSMIQRMENEFGAPVCIRLWVYFLLCLCVPQNINVNFSTLAYMKPNAPYVLMLLRCGLENRDMLRGLTVRVEQYDHNGQQYDLWNMYVPYPGARVDARTSREVWPNPDQRTTAFRDFMRRALE
jgi:hypothetical protein